MSSRLCVPRWATPRTIERETFGHQIIAVAEALGQPLMPWQQEVALVGGEVDSDTGLPAYRDVVITVPRQSGKTTLILSWEVQRARGWEAWGPQRIKYSAQTGNDARKKLLDDQVPLLEPRRKRLGVRQIRRANGNEGVVFVNGSQIGLLASSADSGHGPTTDLGIKDEFFADVDDRRDQALVPSMATKAAGQVVTASTMGTDESIPLNRVVARGRKAVEKQARSGIAYFEYSAGPDDDPDDPAAWWGCMPALGFTISEPVVLQAREALTDSEFRRAFLNQQTKADDRVIPVAAWDAVCSPAARPAVDVTFALDVNPERSSGSIAAASGGSIPIVELVERRDGVGWMPGRAAELSERWGRPRFLIDARGPAASMVAELEDLGVNVVPVAGGELASACGAFYDRVLEARVSVRRHERLDAAAAGASKRPVGDAWAWARKQASLDVSPLLAASLAVWGAAASSADSDFFVV